MLLQREREREKEFDSFVDFMYENHGVFIDVRIIRNEQDFITCCFFCPYKSNYTSFTNKVREIFQLIGKKCFSEGKASDQAFLYKYVFMFAQLLSGIGVTPVTVLAIPYMDENVHPAVCQLYLGKSFSCCSQGQ